MAAERRNCRKGVIAGMMVSGLAFAGRNERGAPLASGHEGCASCSVQNLPGPAGSGMLESALVINDGLPERSGRPSP